MYLIHHTPVLLSYGYKVQYKVTPRCPEWNPHSKKMSLISVVWSGIVHTYRRRNTEIQRNKTGRLRFALLGSVFRPVPQGPRKKPWASILHDLISRSLANAPIIHHLLGPTLGSIPQLRYPSPSQALWARVSVENQIAGWRSKRSAFKDLVQ